MSQVREIKSIINGKEIKGTKKNVIAPYSKTLVAQYEEIDNLSHFSKKESLYKEDQKYKKPFENLAHRLEEDFDEIALITTEETGSPIKYHIQNLSDVINYLKNFNKNKSASDYLLEAKGDILISLSANEPIILATIPLVVALAYGNRVFIKPSSKSPSYAQYLIKTLLSLGVPPQSLGLITPSRSFYKELINQKYFDLIISFGSSKINNYLSQLASKSGVEFISENEGNDWVYLDDMNIFSEDEITKLIIKGFTKHNGQMCDSIRGVFINQKYYEIIMENLKKQIYKIQVGDPSSMSTDVGSLLLGTFEKIQEGIVKYQTYAKNVINNKNDFDKNIIVPTIFENLDLEALPQPPYPYFGPILWTKPVDNIDTVIKNFKLYNPYGLCFSLFSSDKTVIQKTINEISVGRININTDPVEIAASSPWGGIKLSGTGGPRSWEERFTNRKLINIGKYTR